MVLVRYARVIFGPDGSLYGSTIRVSVANA